jgi:hypothetical protein
MRTATQVFLTAILLLNTLSAKFFAAEPVVSAEQIVTNHLNSIGAEAVRSGGQGRVAEGVAQFRILTGGSATLDGKSVLVSTGRKFQFMMKFPNNDYHGERIVFDGDRVQIAGATAQQARSIFGEFLRTQDVAIKEGLLGGTLSTSWPLLNLNDRKAKISYEGLKAIDGKQLMEVRYKPKKNSDMDVHLYFEPGTYRHVRSVYTMTIRAGIARAGFGDVPTPGKGEVDITTAPIAPTTSETASARQHETRYRIEETFGDFKTTDGLTLPTQYVLKYTQELQDGHTNLWEWAISEKQISNNVTLDSRNFEVK